MEKAHPKFVAETKLIVNLTRGKCVCVGEVADRPLRRLRGLMGRRGLPAGEGLLVSPAPAIHTAFMRFPIDALFLDRNLQVLDIVEDLHPWRFASKRRARAVLELSAGECTRRGVRVGDMLELRERSANGPARSHAPDGGLPASADVDSSGPDIARKPQRQRGGLARIRPLRVVVVSSDRHFRTAMSLLLARRNFSVTTTANGARVTELIARESADVVLIDDSQAPAAATVAMVEALARPVGVVLIAEEARPEMPDIPVLAKWGPFGDLLAAIERANERRESSGDTGERG